MNIQRTFPSTYNVVSPDYNSVLRWYRKFEKKNCLCYGKRSGRPGVSEEKVEQVREALQHSHGSRLGCETNGLSRSTPQRALLVVYLLTPIRGIKNFTKRNSLDGVNCNYLHVCIFGLPLNLKQF